MQKLLYSLVAFGCACWSVLPAAGATVTLHKIDDSIFSGDLLAIHDGKLSIAVATTQPSTQPSTQPTTQPADQAAANPTTQPTSIAMSEVVQVFLRDPPKKLLANAAPAATADGATEGNSNRRPGGLFAAIFHVFSSSSDSPADAPGADGAPPKPLPPLPASTTQPATTQPATTQTVTILPVRPVDQYRVAVVTESATSRPAGSVAQQPIAATAPSTQPSVVPSWKLTLVSGDVLHGRIEAWSGKKISFRLDAADGQAVDLPTDQVAEFWCGDPVAREKAKAITLAPGPEDVAFVKKDAEVISVKGLALGIDGDVLRFRFDDQDRKIGLVKLVGVIAGAAGRQKPPHRFHQKIKLDSGEELSGTWTGIATDTIDLQTAWGAALKIPLKNVCTIDFVDGRLVYLSDLAPQKVEQTPYFGRVVPWRADESLAGGPLQLSDGTYSRGIAVHSRCVLEYDVQGSFQRFRTKLGFEQSAGRQGHAAVRVLGDGKALYENLDARGDQPPVEIDVDVTGIKRLTLEVDFGDHTDVAGRVVWANARLLRAEAPH